MDAVLVAIHNSGLRRDHAQIHFSSHMKKEAMAVRLNHRRHKHLVTCIVGLTIRSLLVFNAGGLVGITLNPD
jgi:hypothetical protein